MNSKRSASKLWPISNLWTWSPTSARKIVLIYPKGLLCLKCSKILLLAVKNQFERRVLSIIFPSWAKLVKQVDLKTILMCLESRLSFISPVSLYKAQLSNQHPWLNLFLTSRISSKESLHLRLSLLSLQWGLPLSSLHKMLPESHSTSDPPFQLA